MPGDEVLLDLLREAAVAVRGALDTVVDWGPSGTKEGQYRLDLAADEAALRVLERADVGVLSEETGLHHPERDIWVALDPVDGSTNASRRLPWYATSLCAVDAEGPRVAVVVNQATGDRFEAVRGAGATLNGAPIRPTDCARMADAVIGVTWCPPAHPGCRQVRALGAAALDICAVACGSIDAYIDFSRDAHSPWDYLGGVLVCQEAGAVVVEPSGRDLVTRAPSERRIIVAAATQSLLDEAVALRMAPA
jgi:myo-inositol-1(or 4)-monophosphatase